MISLEWDVYVHPPVKQQGRDPRMAPQRRFREDDCAVTGIAQYRGILLKKVIECFHLSSGRHFGRLSPSFFPEASELSGAFWWLLLVDESAGEGT